MALITVGEKLKYYIVSPYRSVLEDYKKRGLSEQEAIAQIEYFARLGCASVKKFEGIPVSPILAFSGVYDEYDEREKIEEACEVLLKCCQTVCVVDTPYNQYSSGIKKELEIARLNKIPVIILKYKDKGQE